VKALLIAVFCLVSACGWSLPATIGLSENPTTEHTNDYLITNEGRREVDLQNENFENIAKIAGKVKSKEYRVERGDLSDNGTLVELNIPGGVDLKRSYFYGSSDLSFPVCPPDGKEDHNCKVMMAKGKWPMTLWQEKEWVSKFDLVVEEQPMRVDISGPMDWLTGILIGGIAVGDIMVLYSAISLIGSVGTLLDSGWQSTSLVYPAVLVGIGLGGFAIMTASALTWSAGDSYGLNGTAKVEKIQKE